MIDGSEPRGATKLVGAGAWAVQKKAESWVYVVGVMAKRVYTALCSSLLGWWREDRVGLSSEIPRDRTRDVSPSWDKRNSCKMQGSMFFPMRVVKPWNRQGGTSILGVSRTSPGRVHERPDLVGLDQGVGAETSSIQTHSMISPGFQHLNVGCRSPNYAAPDPCRVTAGNANLHSKFI